MEWEFIIRLIVSGILGALIGIERESRYKEAGFRTHFVVAVGSALIMLVSKYGFSDILQSSTIVLDPSRIAAQVVSGIGFLGAGTIIVQRKSVRGLTTAAGLWSTAGIGLAVGAGMYTVGIGATVLVLIALEMLDRVELLLMRRRKRLIVRTENVNQVLAAIAETEIRTSGTHINYVDINTRHPEIELSIQLHTRHAQDIQRLLDMIEHISGVKSVHIE